MIGHIAAMRLIQVQYGRLHVARASNPGSEKHLWIYFAG